MLLKRGTYCTLPVLRHDATADVIDVICAQKQIKKYGLQKRQNRSSIMWCRFLHSIEKKRENIVSHFLPSAMFPLFTLKCKKNSSSCVSIAPLD